jgi:hypothetical protein
MPSPLLCGSHGRHWNVAAATNQPTARAAHSREAAIPTCPASLATSGAARVVLLHRWLAAPRAGPPRDGNVAVETLPNPPAGVRRLTAAVEEQRRAASQLTSCVDSRCYAILCCIAVLCVWRRVRDRSVFSISLPVSITLNFISACMLSSPARRGDLMRGAGNAVHADRHGMWHVEMGGVR